MGEGYEDALSALVQAVDCSHVDIVASRRDAVGSSPVRSSFEVNHVERRLGGWSVQEVLVGTSEDLMSVFSAEKPEK